MVGDGQVLERALDTLDDVFYVYDESGRLSHWNSRLNDLFGLSDDDLDGMLPMDFFEEADRPAVEDALDEIFETGETSVEAWGQTTEGRIRFELTGRLVTDDDGSALGFAGIGRDVTDRYEQTWHLAKQNERLEEFADILAHDLRNPLAVADGHLALARQESDTEALSAVSAAHERMARIVDDVRTASREGMLAADVEPVDLPTLAADAWATVETGDAVLALPPSLSVEADADRIRRLFENLFRNALEHAGPDVTVTLAATDDGFAVEDDGPGIDPADRESVFVPGVSGASEGTGFGLYIVRTIAEAHGWTVEAGESEAGGARFEFDLRAA
ncbi:PAS domain S-box protein [Halomicroarcula sp. F13]|uniref:histidine kinase n=1 Tax=Haloarcula rubra TaxID=2487747 RepID=A0AAW4PRB4_9EURY|nr:ATP-binding protein [Halomicroarcula rubra]MBX0322709.1 PAS domain S-box protein [Halomicroarcula rubra]